MSASISVFPSMQISQPIDSFEQRGGLTGAWLRHFLEDGGGLEEASICIDAAVRKGHNEATLKSVQKIAGVESAEEPGKSVVWWRLEGGPAWPWEDGASPENTRTARQAKRAKVKPLPLPTNVDIGSQWEIALLVRRKLQAEYKQSPVACEGLLWIYNGRCWEQCDLGKLRRMIGKFDGEHYGERSVLRVTDTFIAGTLKCLMYQTADENFFDKAEPGIACRSGLIVFGEGTPKIIPHNPEHRRRFVIDADYPPNGSGLFERALGNVFLGDPDAADKRNVLAEFFGAVALGMAPWELAQPAALLLLGEANCGKSTILEFFAALLPPEAVSGVPLRVLGSRIESHYSGVALAGKQLNISGEMGNSAVLGEAFQEAVTGDRAQGRVPGKEALGYKSRAILVFAGNRLPGLANGLEKPMRRRVSIVRCLRELPEKEWIDDLAARMRVEDMGGLLAFAVEGATRLLANKKRYSRPPCVLKEINEWGVTADVVLAFLAGGGFKKLNAQGRITISDAYKQFTRWADEEGHKRDLPTRTQFIDRVVKGSRWRRVPGKIDGRSWLEECPE